MSQAVKIELAQGTSHIRMFVDIPICRNSQVLLIFVPGLLETADTPLFLFTARIFSAQEKFATVRLDSPSFYGSTGGLKETSIHEQMQDIAIVVSHFRQMFNRIVLIAHSMGAFASLLASNSVDLDCIILWDPSLHPLQIFTPTLYDASQTNFYDEHLGQEMSSNLVKELPVLPDIESMIRRTTCPVGIISAERGAFRVVNPYVLHMPILLGHTIIQNADHNFSSTQHMIALANATIQLIKKAAS